MCSLARGAGQQPLGGAEMLGSWRALGCPGVLCPGLGWAVTLSSMLDSKSLLDLPVPAVTLILIY